MGFFLSLLFIISMASSSHIKQVLYKLCTDFVEQRIQMYQQAMKDAQEAANQEEKSSAGDKYETTRAMMQIEKDKNAKQLEETIKLKKELSQINPNLSSDSIGLGSLVVTDKGNFYLSISVGKLIHEETIYMAIAPTSPLGATFIHLQVGAVAVFNGQTYNVLKVF
ncbi:MAG: transcription elongation factor [Chitinophagaceae bacterium]|nr:transcription elongation factor [Chitinophagaceae bacterium]